MNMSQMNLFNEVATLSTLDVNLGLDKKKIRRASTVSVVKTTKKSKKVAAKNLFKVKSFWKAIEGQLWFLCTGADGQDALYSGAEIYSGKLDHAKKPTEMKRNTVRDDSGTWGAHSYLMQDTNGYSKFGRSGWVDVRAYEIQMCSGSAITIAKIWPDMGKHEATVKRVLKENGRHIHGEWFNVTPDEIDLIMARIRTLEAEQ